MVGLRAEAAVAKRLANRLNARIEAGGGHVGGADAAVGRLIAAGARRLVSFGLAGGLDPELRPGDLLIPECVILDGRRVATDPALSLALGGPTRHTLLAGDDLIATAFEKRALFAVSSAGAVDLETAAVARSGLPFAAMRAICDPAERSLPPAARIALDDKGAIGLWRVLKSVLQRPSQIPALVTLAGDAARARAALVRQSGVGR